MGLRGSIVCVLALCGACSAATTLEPDASRGHDAGHVLGIDGSMPPRRDGGVLPSYDGGLDAVRDADAIASTCTTTCSIDEDCMRVCGAVPGGGHRCCDGVTSHCYVTHSASCPSAPVDAGYDTVRERLDGCPRPPLGTTQLIVHAPGLPSTTLTIEAFYSGSTTQIALDANGEAVVNVPAFVVDRYYGMTVLSDGSGYPLTFHLSRGSASADFYPACVAPDPADLAPLDVAEVVIQRDRATGLCAGSVLRVVLECTAYYGDYTASRFDDMPCGPF